MIRDYSDMLESNCKLHDEVLEGNLGSVKALLESEACDVNEVDEQFGRTALHLAARRGNAEMLSVLLSHGADVNACDHQGNTPLHWCGHTETIELLAEHGAHIIHRNKRGFSPRDLAERKGVSESVYGLLCQLEVEARDTASCQPEGADTSAASRLSESSPGRRQRTCLGQPLSGLWQELAEELGGRNFVLLILGLLAASLYVTYYLVGVNYGAQARIPIGGDSDSFRIRI